MWARVGSQDGTQALTLGLGDETLQLVRNLHLQRFDGLVLLLRKAAACLGMTIHVGQIRFDVEDGCAVHQVGSIHFDDRTLRCVEVDGENTHTGKPDMVGTERAAGGPYTHASVAAQAWWAHSGTPRFAVVSLTEIPQKPDVAVAFQSAQRIGIPVFGSEDDACRQSAHQSALARNPKLGGEISMYVRDDMHGGRLFAALQKAHHIENPCCGEAKGKCPPYTRHTPVTGETEQVAQRERDDEIGKEGYPYHGFHVGHSTKGVGKDALHGITVLIDAQGDDE